MTWVRIKCASFHASWLKKKELFKVPIYNTIKMIKYFSCKSKQEYWITDYIILHIKKKSLHHNWNFKEKYYFGEFLVLNVIL